MWFLVLVLFGLVGWLFYKVLDLSFRLEKLERKSAPEPVQKSEPAPAPAAEIKSEPILPKPIPKTVSEPVNAAPTRDPISAFFTRLFSGEIHWEQFLGVKLFAWIGGLVLFLAVAFFVKYSFDQGLLSPAVRVTLGFLLAIGLVVSSLFLPRPKFKVLAQTFAAAGILILYADLFSSHALYDFIPSLPTFLLMILTTSVAFLLAIRLEAQVVAVLGLAGGFLTPPLLSTGQDNPLGLFSYIALLNLGLISISLWKRWHYLVLLAAAGTFIMEWGWVSKFFSETKFWTAFTVFISFAVLFVGPIVFLARKKIASLWTTIASLILSASAFAFSFYMVEDLGEKAVSLFLFVFLADLAVLALVWFLPAWRLASLVSGGLVFIFLSIWTVNVKQEQVTAALGAYFVFALLHTIWPMALERFKPEAKKSWWIHLFPLVALGLVFYPLYSVHTLTLLFWPSVLAIDLVAIVAAVLTGSFFAILGVSVLTLILVGCFIGLAPQIDASLGGVLILIGAFAILFAGATVFSFLYQKKKSGQEPKFAFLFPAASSLSGILPFILLSMVIFQLKPENPSSVFGLALLLSVLYLSVGVLLRMNMFFLTALMGALFVVFSGHATKFHHGQPFLALAWYTAFSLFFFAFPFFLMRRLGGQILPWVSSALSWPLHFVFFYKVVQKSWPNDFMGLVPAVLALLPLTGLVIVVRRLPALDLPEIARLRLLALFGGASLFFITFIFPIQFSREWITIGWALEGAALVWLFRRVAHPGLLWVAAGLFAVSFARLALNKAVFDYHPRTDASILNWYLYAYGLTAASFFTGAILWSKEKGKIFGWNVAPIFYTFGSVLVFLLLNIEIANYFSEGETLTFQFSGNLAQDTAYSIGWGLFALAVLILGFRFGSKAARYAGLGLLVVTILKLFLHDLFRLGGLYRIGSLIGLAVVLILVSFIYQKFLSRIGKPPEK